MPSTCELKSKQLWAGNEEKCISLSQLQLRDQTTGVAVRSVPPSSHPSNVSISQPTWQQSVPHHTTHQNRTDKTNRPWTAAIPELPTPKSQISNSPHHAPQQHGTSPSRVSTTCRASTPFSPRPVRKKRSEHTKHLHTAHVTGCLKQRSVVVVASSVGMGWMVFVLLTCCGDSGVWLLGARW